jgi:hypothetical protein
LRCGQNDIKHFYNAERRNPELSTNGASVTLFSPGATVADSNVTD